MKDTITFDAYVRVSSVRGRSGESFISPDTQKDRIHAWAKSQGYEIAKVWDERDESGGTVDRPMLNEVMQRIEAGETGGVVVFKLDRFGRTLIDSLALIERIREAGGTFASVNDGFDLSTETGRLVLRIMLSLAEYELERIRANWREARERAVGRGHHLTATVPFGFQRRSDSDTRLAPHPVNGPIVTEIFERRAAGSNWADLRRWMESTGARTQRGRSIWTQRALRDIIRNDVYLGIASNGEFRREGAHDPLTDETTWRRAQRHGTQTVSKAAEPAMLAGVLRCAGCRYGMRASARRLADGRIVHDYRCRCGAEQAGNCAEQATATGTDGIEEWVIDQFFDKIEEVELDDLADRSRLAELTADRDRAREALDAYASDARVQTAIGMDAYVAGLQTRQAAYQAARAVVDAEDDATAALGLSEDAVSTLRAEWPTLTVDAKRRLLALAIDCVFVRRRNGAGAVSERSYICWRGSAPSDLPGQGVRGYVPKPFVLPDDPAPAGMALAHDR